MYWNRGDLLYLTRKLISDDSARPLNADCDGIELNLRGESANAIYSKQH